MAQPNVDEAVGKDRQEALAKGFRLYRGKPCRRCDETLRNTNGGACQNCRSNGRLKREARERRLTVYPR